MRISDWSSDVCSSDLLGTPRVADVNHVDTVAHGGMGYQTTPTWKGRRFSAARAFLSPIRDRSNLDIVPDTDVRRILFTNQRAPGVVIRDMAGERTLKVGQEILISAGAIHSPPQIHLSAFRPPPT